MARDASVSEVAKRVYWREAEGRVVVDAWRSSGETMSRFARRHRVDSIYESIQNDPLGLYGPGDDVLVLKEF